MTTHRFVWGPFRATLAATLVAAVVSLFAFVQSGAATQAAEDQVEDQHHEGRIVGGTAVPDGKYRFVAALLNTNSGTTPFEQQFCGGTLIDEDSVLTAAHCVFGQSPQPLRVTVGRTVLNSTQGQVRSVSSIAIHPSYNPPPGPGTSQAYDAAVLQLNRGVGGVPRMRLATARHDFLETPGRNATVAGWGNTIAQPAGGGGPSPSFPNRMREAQVPLVSDEQAKMVYGASYFEPLMVAAGREGKDTCQGDSGGPMFAKANRRYRQIGITSFGAGCGAQGYPGVYAEVNAPAIRDFIVAAAA
jgi:secreted trypsin-like serine protease